MSVSVQKAALTSQVNLQRMQLNSDALKVSVLKTFIDEWEKLWAFLIKLELYIKFNQTKFKFKMNKRLFITFFFKNAAFN